jgi:sucrose phosphorylase
MQNKVQLIAYVDRLGGGSLADLAALLRAELADVFGGVHLLPFFYPIDGSDAGFDPIDHTKVDPRLGDWDCIAALAKDMPIMSDVIVNHVSSDSPQFKDVSEKGSASEHSELFMTMSTVFPNGATEEELLAIYRPRPGLPFTYTTLKNGEKRIFWTTFTPKQIDINVEHAQGRAYLESILDTLAKSGVTMIRLDAVGYAIKRAGTSSFMLPETFEFIDQFAAKARARGLEVLVEIHSYFQRQIEIAKRVDWVYDFALPPLVLHALLFKKVDALTKWFSIRPQNAVTVLDTHDGIGIIDIGADAGDRAGRPGLVPPAELDRLVEMIHENCNGQSREATGAAASNLDLYQVNCTYYDALGANDSLYLLARAIQFFTPGVPQVYYMGLLAEQNDMALLRKTKVGRDINRHHFTRESVAKALQRPVTARLIELIKLRNTHPAFNGAFTFASASASTLTLRWTQGRDLIELNVDVALSRWTIRATSSENDSDANALHTIMSSSQINTNDRTAHVSAATTLAAI